MNGPFSKESGYLNCNDQLTDRYQKHMNSTAGHFPVSIPRLLHFLVSLVVPKRPGRLQHFSFQSMFPFQSEMYLNWSGVGKKRRKYLHACSTLAFI